MLYSPIEPMFNDCGAFYDSRYHAKLLIEWLAQKVGQRGRLVTDEEKQALHRCGMKFQEFCLPVK